MTALRRALVAGLAVLAGASASILPPSSSGSLGSELVLAPDETSSAAGSASTTASSSSGSDSTSTSASASASASASSSQGRACNNSPQLCDRPFNNVTFMGAHDSAFLRDDSTNNSLAGNQYKNATLALDAGIRLLQAQVHQQDGQLRLCHTLCTLLDAGPLELWLANITAWMNRNPNDVVTILLVNSDDAPASELAAAFTASGIAALAFLAPTPSPSAVWPSLGQMIDQGTRAALFVTNVASSSSAPYILPEFDYLFETPFTVTDTAGFNCTLDRPPSLSSGGGAAAIHQKGLLSLVNHFKDIAVTASILIPDVDALGVVNSADATTQGSLGRHMSECGAQWGKQPNFALVDFWDVGATVQVADQLNGIKDASGRSGESAAAADSRGTGLAVNMDMNVARGALVVFLAMALTL